MGAGLAGGGGFFCRRQEGGRNFWRQGGDEIRILQGGDRGGIFSENFQYTNQKFAACGGPIFSLIVFTTAYLPQKCHEQPPDFKMASKLAIFTSISLKYALFW